MSGPYLYLHIETTDVPGITTLAALRGWLQIEGGQPVIAADGLAVPNAAYGVQMHLAGPRVLVAATYDANGDEVTPAVLDTAARVFVRLFGAARAAEMTGETVTDLFADTLIGQEFAAGTWDEARKAWRHPDGPHWLVDPTQRPAEHGWLGDETP